MAEKLQSDKGDPYTMTFIENKGGSEDVARKTGINRQTTRQVATGRNAPSYDFILKMIGAYPDYDIRASVPRKRLVTAGQDTEDDYTDYADIIDPPNAEITTIPVQVLAAENAGLKREIKRLEETVSILHRVVSSQLRSDLETGKTESIDDSTLGKQLFLNLDFARRSEKRFIPVSMRDAFGVDARWNVRP